MAIELPPPIEPVLAPLEQVLVPAIGDSTIDYQGVAIHVTGPDGRLAPAQRAALARLVAEAPSISDAVRVIGRYFYLSSGLPAAITRYAVSDSRDLFVHVSAGHVAVVDAPDPLRPYFAALVHAEPLRAAELERARVLGDAVSERGGLRYQPQFRLREGDAVTLEFGPAVATVPQTAVYADVSNYGNRYAAPYLLDAALRQSFASGDELSLAGTTSLRVLGLGGSHSEPYHGGSLGWSRVTTLGVFSVAGRLADFRQSVPQGVFDGRIGGGTLGWLFPIHADINRRINSELKFERNHERLTATPTAPGSGYTASETSNTAAWTLSYTQRLEAWTGQAEVSASVSLRKGIPGGSSVETAASTGYFVWQPSLDARLGLGAGFSAIGSASGQFGGSVVPQLEQFVIGGPQSLHAYQSGAGAGDTGAAGRLGIEWRDSDGSWLETYGIRPQLFAEYGTARLRRTELGTSAGRIEAADVGIETGLRFADWLGGTLSVAESIHENGGSRSGNELARRYVFFQLVAKY